MKRTFLLGVVLPFMLILNSSNVHCIVGGQNAQLGAFPAQVAIDLPNNVFCGGTIVNANHIVTAARCVFNIQTHLVAANLVTVRGGVVDLNLNPPRVDVVAIFPHPQYNPFTNQNNVAVLRVAQNYQFPPGANPALAPANMAENIIPDNADCRISGWLPTVAQPNPTLLTLNTPIMNRDICNGVAIHMGRVGESMLCAGNNANNIGVCPATQGGGLICTVNNNNLFVGVLTGGFGCGSPNSPGIYTQVRVHRQWILQQFNRADIPAAGPTPAPAGVNQPPTNDDSGADKSLVSVFMLITSIFVALFKM